MVFVQAIVLRANQLQLYQQNPRMVPIRFNPKPSMVEIVTNEYVNALAKKARPKKQDALMNYDELKLYKLR